MNNLLSSITIDDRFWKRLTFTLLSLLALFTLAQPALAHHPSGGETPSNLWEGFLSGLGHPVIGIDHLVFIIASGLIAVGSKRGWIIPVGFVLAAMVGTAIHLQAVDLPLLESVIGASVLAMGILLTREGPKDHEQSLAYTMVIAFGSAIAGIFHGYAYGEAIVGAEMTALVAYLAGFTLIQLAIALTSYKLAKTLLTQFSTPTVPLTRLIGCGIMGMGIVFMTSAV